MRHGRACLCEPLTVTLAEAFHRVPSLGASAVPDPALTGAELVQGRGIRLRPDILLFLVDVIGSCRAPRLSGG